MAAKAPPKQKPLTHKHKLVLDYYLGDYFRNKAEAWKSQHKMVNDHDADLQMRKLLGRLAAKRYIAEAMESVLGNDQLKNLKAMTIKRLATRMWGDDRFLKPGDLAKLASVLSRITGWQDSAITFNVPDLHIVVSNEPVHDDAVTNRESTEAAHDD